MGTCSLPLFVSITPGKPEDYIIDSLELSQEDIDNWNNYGFLSEENKTLYTLTDFMNTGSDCHKIIFYFNQEKINMWVKLCKYITKKYKIIENIKFHFYCQDEKFPYYIEYISQYNKLILFCGGTDSIFWFKINEELSTNNKLRITFDDQLYRLRWQEGNFKNSVLYIGFS